MIFLKIQIIEVISSTKNTQNDNKNKQVDNIEIIQSRKRNESDKHSKIHHKEIKTEINTIDKSNFTTIQNSNKVEAKYSGLDNVKADNSRNNGTFMSTDKNYVSVKAQRQEKIDNIKNRRTGSTDCTNNKLNRKDFKRVPNFDRRDIVELDTDEGEIIVSNRHNDSNKVSPSPSPVKYDLEPGKYVDTHGDELSQSKASNYDPKNR